MKWILFSLSVLALFSCSEYNKILKSDDYQRKFEYANEMYEKEKYDRCIAMYEQIYQRFPKTGQGEVAYYRIGKSYFYEKDYYMGGYYLGTYHTRFPFSPKAEEALFLSALCSVKNSPQASLDQTDTELAINDLQLFVNRYPNSELVDTCNQVIDKMRLKLQTKDFEAVQLYNKTENFRAAVVAGESFVESYPLSTYLEEVKYIVVKNSADLAINSVESKKAERIEETKKRYRNFVAEFPSSEYIKELQSSLKKVENEGKEKK